MCIFNTGNGYRFDVNRTTIVTIFDGHRQCIIYSNETSVASRQPKYGDPSVAMILPVAGKHISFLGEESGRHAKAIMNEFREAFRPKMQTRVRSAMSMVSSAPREFLRVEKTGNYEVSVATSLDEIQRADPRVFIVNPQLIKILSSIYGTRQHQYLIVRLVPGTKYEPLMYTFIPNDINNMEIPTVHVHPEDGEMTFHDTEDSWDHEIYAYGCTLHPSPSFPFREEYTNGLRFEFTRDKSSIHELAATIKTNNKYMLVSEIPVIKKWTVQGEHPNRDFYLRPDNGETTTKCPFCNEGFLNIETMYVGTIPKTINQCSVCFYTCNIRPISKCLRCMSDDLRYSLFNDFVGDHTSIIYTCGVCHHIASAISTDQPLSTGGFLRLPVAPSPYLKGLDIPESGRVSSQMSLYGQVPMESPNREIPKTTLHDITLIPGVGLPTIGTGLPVAGSNPVGIPGLTLPTVIQTHTFPSVGLPTMTITDLGGSPGVRRRAQTLPLPSTLGIPMNIPSVKGRSSPAATQLLPGMDLLKREQQRKVPVVASSFRPDITYPKVDMISTIPITVPSVSTSKLHIPASPTQTRLPSSPPLIHLPTASVPSVSPRAGQQFYSQVQQPTLPKLQLKEIH